MERMEEMAVGGGKKWNGGWSVRSEERGGGGKGRWKAEEG